MHVGVKAYGPDLLDPPDFDRGLVVIVEEEVEEALRDWHRKLFERLQEASSQ